MRGNDVNNNSLPENLSRQSTSTTTSTSITLPSSLPTIPQEAQSHENTDTNIIKFPLYIPVSKVFFYNSIQKQNKEKILEFSQKLDSELNSVLDVKNKKELFYKNLCNSCISHAIDLLFELPQAADKTFEARIDSEISNLIHFGSQVSTLSSAKQDEIKIQFVQKMIFILETEILPFIKEKKEYFIKDFTKYLIQGKDEVNAYFNLIQSTEQSEFYTPRALTSATEILREQNERILDLEERNRRAAEQIDRTVTNYQSQLENQIRATTAAKDELEKVKEAAQKSNQENIKLTTDKTNLRESLDSANVQLSAARQNINLESFSTDAQSVVSGQIALNVSLEGENNNLKGIVEQKEQRITSLSGRIETLELEKNILQYQKNNLEERTSVLEEQAQLLHSENETYRSENQRLQAENLTTRETNQEINSRNQQLSEATAILTEQLRSNEEETTRIQAANATLRAEILRLENLNNLEKIRKVCSKIIEIGEKYTAKNQRREIAITVLRQIFADFSEYCDRYQPGITEITPSGKLDDLKDRLINIFMQVENDHRSKSNSLTQKLQKEFSFLKTESRLSKKIKEVLDDFFPGIDYDVLNAIEKPSLQSPQQQSTTPLYTNTTTTSTASSNQQIEESQQLHQSQLY